MGGDVSSVWGIVLSLAGLIYLAYRGVSVLVLAPLAAAVAADGGCWPMQPESASGSIASDSIVVFIIRTFEFKPT